MSLQFEELADELDHLAAAPMPPSTVDVARAQVDGRRLLRRRRNLRSVVATVAVAAVAAVSFVLAPAGGGTSTAIAPADPLVVNAQFSWLPSGYEVNSYQVVEDSSQVFASSPTDLGSQWTLITYLDNDVLAHEPIVDPVSTRVGSLNGYPVVQKTSAAGTAQKFAFTVTPTPGVVRQTFSPENAQVSSSGAGSLTWRSSAGQWAVLWYQYPRAGDEPAVSTLMHVASTVTFSPALVSFPFSIGGLKKGTVQWASRYLYAAPGKTPQSQLAVDIDGLEVRIYAVRAGTAFPEEPAGVTSRADAVINGMSYSVQLAAAGHYGGVPPSGAGNAQEFLSRIVSYGSDMAHWTTNVLV